MKHEFSHAEVLHRLVKHALDNGSVASLADAKALFSGYKLGFKIGPSEVREPHHQAALLTGVALAKRVFLGGVSVEGDLDAPLRALLPLGPTLANAVEALGGVVETISGSTPRITIGSGLHSKEGDFHVRTAYAGWRGGVLPADSKLAPTGDAIMPLASMLAAALAVNEAFLYVNGDTIASGRRAVGLSLWRPDADVDWLAPAADEPKLCYLPTRLWMIGLGHLGQAFVWGLGLLRYMNPADLHLVLQDVDVITPSTESTSILSNASLVGQKKTRAVAAWAERRGFSTTIHERLFDASFRRQNTEPSVALCGLDNALGRRALDQVGFDFVVEAGLGRGHRDFRTMRLHTLPGSRTANDIWKPNADSQGEAPLPAAYQEMLDAGELDRCGVTLLSGKAVGAPFVGAVAATLALTEVLRLLQGGPLYHLIDLDLQCVEHRTAVPHRLDFNHLNPGYVVSAGSFSG